MGREVGYLHNGILFNHEMEENIDQCDFFEFSTYANERNQTQNAAYDSFYVKYLGQRT